MKARLNTIRLPVKGYAASVIETDIVDAWGTYDEEHEEPYETVIRLAWNGKALVFDRSVVNEVSHALNEMSNRCDELSTDSSMPSDERLAYRNASVAFATLMQKARRQSLR